ncbi:DUF4167 domain-containing protein [Pseudooceanicola sp. MF1-13]|uniref:DUF4167 domain-containing protein n=1 Tax=Pseudooceanicola sp. MF1-13 TaxID=3379095 RepID=UPI003892C5FF
MRSSKSRSRNKSNRNRSVGNIVNRVFDSSGPEGKVRGTPQQIIDKYNQLARDAQLSGDRVATENFQQHAEHYLRMLGTAQKEQEKQREQQENENRKRQSERDRSKPQDNELGEDAKDPGAGDQPEVVEQAAGDSTLVETPEQSKDAGAEQGAKPKRTYNRKPRAKKSDNQDGQADKPAGDSNPAAAE